MNEPFGSGAVPLPAAGLTMNDAEALDDYSASLRCSTMDFNLTQAANDVIGEASQEPWGLENDAAQEYSALYEDTNVTDGVLFNPSTQSEHNLVAPTDIGEHKLDSLSGQHIASNIGDMHNMGDMVDGATGNTALGDSDSEGARARKKERREKKDAKRKRREQREFEKKEKKSRGKSRERDKSRRKDKNESKVAQPDGYPGQQYDGETQPAPRQGEEEGDNDFIDDSGVGNDHEDMDPDDSIPVEGGIDSEDEKGPKHSSFDDVLARMRKRKKRKNHESINVEDVEAHVHGVLTTMKAAADADKESFKNSQPGTAKLQLVDQIVEEISQPKFSRWYIRNKLADVLAAWLEPLQDNPLVMPNVTIRSKVLQLLQKLPIGHQEVGTELGPRLIQLWKYSEETEENRLLIRNLVARWMRPVFHLRASYKQMQQHPADEALEVAEPGHSRRSYAERGDAPYDSAHLMDETAVDQEHAKRRHATVPSRTGYNFKVLPQSDYDGQDNRPGQDRMRSVMSTSRRQAQRSRKV